MSNISSRFSSSQTAPQRSPGQPQQSQPLKSPPAPNGNASAGAQKTPEEVESVEPYIPSKPKESSGSFFSSLTRKLSSASQGSGIPKVQGTGGVCPRRVLNVDPNRERCLVPELDQSKLRRVSFCVDVEIAGGPKYTEDAGDDDPQKKRKKKDVKLKERAEGEALKHPESITEEKDEHGEPVLEAQSKAIPVPGQENGEANNPSGSQEDVAGSPMVGSLEDGSQGMTRKKEKKKRSEVERKERKEKKLRRAQENGSIPIEMMANDDDDDSGDKSSNGACGGESEEDKGRESKEDEGEASEKDEGEAAEEDEEGDDDEDGAAEEDTEDEEEHATARRHKGKGVDPVERGMAVATAGGDAIDESGPGDDASVEGTGDDDLDKANKSNAGMSWSTPQWTMSYEVMLQQQSQVGRAEDCPIRSWKRRWNCARSSTT